MEGLVLGRSRERRCGVEVSVVCGWLGRLSLVLRGAWCRAMVWHLMMQGVAVRA